VILDGLVELAETGRITRAAELVAVTTRTRVRVEAA